LGEVEKLTGIPKRELKYYIERKLMRPSYRSEIGYWLYSDEDIQNAQIVSLCRELDYPDETIRTILADPRHSWCGELDKQILRLTEKRNRMEARLFLAEYLRYSGCTQSVRDSILQQWRKYAEWPFRTVLCGIISNQGFCRWENVHLQYYFGYAII